MTDLEQYLRGYMGVSDEDMSALVAYFHPTTLEKGDYFLRTGKICDKLSFQRSGLLRVYALHGMKEVTQWISFTGNFMTDLGGIICDTPSHFDVRALTQCTFYTINKEDYLRLPQLIPRWSQLERILITRCFSFIEGRVFGLLSMSAEERYTSLMNTNPELIMQVPLKYLASMMGMTPESLSRIRKKMGS